MKKTSQKKNNKRQSKKIIKKVTNKSYAITIGLVLLALALLTMVFSSRDNSSYKRANLISAETPKPTHRPIYQLVDRDLLSVQSAVSSGVKQYNLSMLVGEPSRLIWVTQDGFRIVVKNENPGIDIQDYTCNDQKVALKDRESAYMQKAEDMGKVITRAMTILGFSQNYRNTDTTFIEHKQTKSYDYLIGYESENKVCIFNANPDCSAYAGEKMHDSFTVNCVEKESLTQAIIQQIPFQKDLNRIGQSMYPQLIDGDFANLTAGGPRGGYLIIVKKIDGKWTEIWSGNGAITCDPIIKAGIPTSIVETCVDTKTDKVIPNPN